MPINFLAVLLVGVANMAIGFVWYGPLFANAWMKELGITEDDIKGGPGIGYFYTFIAALVMGAITSLFVHFFGITDLATGALFGLMLGVGYVATSFASNYVFTQKSLKLYLIDTTYQVLAIVAAGAITTLIR